MVQIDAADDSGAIAILVAVLSVVLFGFAAIVVDLGYARTVKDDAQSAVDAASLAGASILADDSSPAGFVNAINAIKDSARDNFGTTLADWGACSATPPNMRWKQGGSATSCILFNRNASNPTKLQVVLPSKHIDSFFGGLLGYNGMDVNALAQSTIHAEDIPGCALCVRGRLDVSGPVAVGPATPDGSGGSVAANTGRVRSGGSITVQPDGAIAFANTADPSPPSGPMYSPDPIYPKALPDPFLGPSHPMPAGQPGSFLRDFPTPPTPPTPSTVACPGDVPSLMQGVIYRNVNVTGACPASGVIVVTGTLHVTSTGSLTSTSAAIQLTCRTRRTGAATICASGRAGGLLQIDLGGQVSISTPFASEFSLAYDPNNISAMTINGSLSVDKAIYARSSPVTVGASASVSASDRISVNSLRTRSRAAVDVTTDVDPDDSVPGPPFVGLLK